MPQLFHLLLGLLLGSTVSAADLHSTPHTPPGDSVLVVDRFDYPNEIGKFPSTWEGRTGWRQTRTRNPEDLYYTVQQGENGNFFLSAKTIGKATNAGTAVHVNLRVYNRLRWRWRVFELPVGGNEKIKNKNDSAASVRLVFHGGIVPKTLRYVWSATLPVGTETVSPSSDQTEVIVLESGPPRNLGAWVWEEVDAYEDYKRLFGGEPRLVEAVAVLTDSDNTDTFVMADYDDIMFIRGSADSTQEDSTPLDEDRDPGKSEARQP